LGIYSAPLRAEDAPNSGVAGMCHIHDVVREQNTYCADVNQKVLEVVQAMVERNIGAVPVLRDGKLVGIFSERDLMHRIVVDHRNPEETLISEVMTPDPLVVHPDEEMENCMALMRRHGFRHLPICADGKLVGMVSLRDMLLRDLNDKSDEVRMMRAYIQSSPEV
jgi:CBS domain-containing protein